MDFRIVSRSDEYATIRDRTFGRAWSSLNTNAFDICQMNIVVRLSLLF